MDDYEQQEFDAQQRKDYLHALLWAGVPIAVIWVLIIGFLSVFN